VSRMFFDDRVVWAVSILLAVLLWVNVTGARAGDVQRTFTAVPVQWRDLPDDLSVVDMEPSRVDVTVRGVRDVMQHVTREDFIATVSLTGADVGRMDHFVTVSVPRGVQLVQAAPQTVEVETEESIEEVYSITVDIQGQADVTLADPTVEPSQVVVNGPSTSVREVDRVVAEVVVDGATEGVTKRVICTPVDDRGRMVRGVMVSPRQVDVHVPEQATQIVREVPVRPLILTGDDVNILVRKMRSEPELVTVEGDEELVGELEYVRTEPIDMTELQEEYGEELEDLAETIESQETDEEEEDEYEIEDVEQDEMLLEVSVQADVTRPRDELGMEVGVDPETVTVYLQLQKMR